MPAFRYSAINAAGELVRGTTDAADEAAVVAQLRRQGLVPARVEAASGRSSIRDLLSMEFGRRGGLGRQEVTNVTRELAIMLEAGQDMDRALRFLVETAPNARVGRVLDEIRQAVRDGSSLAAALTRHSQSFSRLYIGLVRAGEAGGTLAATLERLATLMERERSLAATVQSALIYPALLLLAAIGSITLLLTEVLPQFVPLFEQNGVELPRPTQILIAVGGVRVAGRDLCPAAARCAGPGRRDRRCACRVRGCWWTGGCCACRSSARWPAISSPPGSAGRWERWC